ncbi:NAD(P)-dependent oxidoreductase [Streptomyces sp. NPDC006691]|uniref:NAD(P)-dependent oxidoreductase n=1 Tax=Streptomyces sp. NPDC006691 TaxID=3364757 RepID=UPI0036C7A61A
MSSASRASSTSSASGASSTSGGSSGPAVAVLGTGIMGSGMARSLLRAGLGVRVWNRTEAKARVLADDGATAFADAAEAVRGADVVLTALNDGPSVSAALEAAADGLHAGQLWLQTSTVGPDAALQLAHRADELGVVYYDSPVLGTKAPAEQGKLTVFVSGAPEGRERLTPVLDAIGQRTVWVSHEPGGASRLKLVANTWVINLVGAVAECLGLAEALQVDPRLFLDAVAGGPLDTGYLHAKAAALLTGDLTPSFALSTALKDTRLILEAAEQAGVRLDLTEASAERFARAEAAGHGAEDMIATYYAGRAEE